MNHLLESELEREAQHYSDDREISLGPGTILGLFFVLALICACFFGFGYSVGHRSAASVIPAVVIPTNSASTAAKPSAGSFTPPALTTSNAPEPGIPTDAAVAAAPKAATQPPAAVPVSAASGIGSFMVQVAAVSSQQIADIEVSALRKDGYAVVVRHEPQDTLLHVQIGPFADKKEAEAMRQRVVADGFNAIVK
jgi:DedD protein